MEKYLIEVPHAGDKASCVRAVQVFLSSGSHFVTNAEWGCKDGEHKAWLIVEVESREDAMRILPSAYKKDAKITRISKFTRKDMEEAVLKHHT
jgi:replicative superfamily II helicase